MNKDKIIGIAPFLKGNVESNSASELVEKTAEQCLDELLRIICEEGHDIEDDDLIKDITIIYHLLIASLNRLENIEDKNIQVLDNCKNQRELE